MYSLLLDEREKGLQALDPTIPHKVLECGDISILNESEEVVVVIERKSFKDLEASILDGRYKEQCARLNAFEGPLQKGFIIEGSIKSLRSDKNVAIVQGAILSIVFGYGFFLIYTDSVENTLKACKSIMQKLSKKDEGYYNSEAGKSTGIKKSKMTEDNYFLRTLCMIPGVSSKVGSCIVEKWPTRSKFTDSWVVQGSDKPDLTELTSIVVSVKNGKERKIGKALANKIFCYMNY